MFGSKGVRVALIVAVSLLAIAWHGLTGMVNSADAAVKPSTALCAQIENLNGPNPKIPSGAFAGGKMALYDFGLAYQNDCAAGPKPQAWKLTLKNSTLRTITGMNVVVHYKLPDNFNTQYAWPSLYIDGDNVKMPCTGHGQPLAKSGTLTCWIVDPVTQFTNGKPNYFPLKSGLPMDLNFQFSPNPGAGGPISLVVTYNGGRTKTFTQTVPTAT